MGDVNADGIDDFIVSAPDADSAVSNDSGAVYLVFGQNEWNSTLNLEDLGAQGVRFVGVGESDHAGAAVNGLGDINGDGFDDFAIGAPDALKSGETYRSGQTYIVYGSDNWQESYELSNIDGSFGLTIDGIGNDDFGSSVATAGDFNGDGLADILLGAPAASGANDASQAGETYVIYGDSGFFI